MNIITTVGYLTQDPQISTTNGGQQVCKFGIGSNNKRRDEQNNHMTNFYNCTVWGKTGETIAKFFKKGQRIMVSGDLTIRDYVDKSGNTRTSVDIDVRDWDFGAHAQAGAGAQAQAQPAVAPPMMPAAQAPQYAAPPTYAPQQGFQASVTPAVVPAGYAQQPQAQGFPQLPF